MNSIIDLRETSPDHWQAKYQGNYGVYTIKITTDGKNRKAFSCSCPSSYSPCKHIPMVEEAIAKRIAKNAVSGENGESAEEVLGKLSHKELYDFIVRFMKYNPELTSAVFLEFSEKIKNESENKYISIIRRELADVVFDERDYYDEEEFYIDVLDQWNEKAEEYLENEKPEEAILIARAYIEEFADWLQEKADDEFIDCISETYYSFPFEILKRAAASPGVNTGDLYDYCRTQMVMEKYSGFYMADCFSGLFMTLSKEINPEAFIELQRQLLGNIKDKSSYEAEKILNRIIYFYNDLQEPEKAWEYVENNIQISRFRKQVVEKRIEEKKFAEAKKLIRDYIEAKTMHHLDEWDDFLLQIALAENDISATRRISHSFIKDSFREQYYQIYKAAFTSDEWPEKFEELLAHYKAGKNFWDRSAAELLAAEGMGERLMEYIEKNLSLEKIERYHAFFAAAFPQKTLALFRKAVDDYAHNNTGRSCYAHIVDVFDKMKKIPGGDTITADMKAAYLLKYKNRRAMKEILNRS